MRILIAMIAATLVAISPSAGAQTLSGEAHVLDGDTIDLGGITVRLAHLDAPETAQTCEREGETWPCGAAAREHLTALTAGNPLTCTVQTRDEHTRSVAVCETKRFDIGAEMLRAGLAVADREAPFAYLEASDLAQEYRLGMWAGTFAAPADWRAQNPELLVPEPPTMAEQVEQDRGEWSRQARKAATRQVRGPFGCAIKGNVSRRMGERIYYLPGMEYYDQTRAEAFFCTEAEAQAAGYRRSRAG